MTSLARNLVQLRAFITAFTRVSSSLCQAELRSRPLHLHVVKPGNLSSIEPSQRRNGKHAEHCYDNHRCLPLYLNSKTKHGISTNIRLVRKACDEGSPRRTTKGHTGLEHPARRPIAWAYATI
ncbi:hypothetical protein V8E54_012961 [Elaphomyces granulatus]